MNKQDGIVAFSNERDAYRKGAGVAVLDALNKALAANRPEAAKHFEDFQNGARVRRFVVKRKFPITNGSNDTLLTFSADAQKRALFPSPAGDSSFPASSPPGRVFVIDTLRVRMPSNKTIATMEALLQGLWFRFHYQDAKAAALEVPLSELAYANVEHIATGISGPATVTISAALRHRGKDHGYKLNDSDKLIVCPNDTVKHVEAFWSGDVTAPSTLIGDETAYEMDVEAEGDLYLVK